MQTTHIIPEAWLSVIWLHFLIGGITQICSQANDSSCDARITQQPSPYIIDGSNSTMTLTCNVTGAIETVWHQNLSDRYYPVVCQEKATSVNRCTYRPTRGTANIEMRCQASFITNTFIYVYCTPNILLAACDVRMTQQPSPYIIDGSNSTMTLTCNVDGATEFDFNYNVSGGFLPCIENNNRVNTCTYRPQRDTANQEVRCRAGFPTDRAGNLIFCTPNIQFVTTTTSNPNTASATNTTATSNTTTTTGSALAEVSSTSFWTILGSAMAAVVALIVVMVVVIWKRRVPEPQVTSTGQKHPQQPDTILEDSQSEASEASSTGPDDSEVDTDKS